ncbi:AglZ/HisF2 family acetamidino modification protein [Pararcticibacter amylolyticus]|uniref:imidazole glycerol-phosphate synthase n=1 Tax=Pararcticibacter amylolyticus TaxID=2173175 RepID=A0A2U2PI01_9SPHI|nr:AglZ/HisF2 family acetamidino modification protein [Pararcticibacter amylolyticus]PWG81033.1 imidazole glycerol phosphate synthase subunit HisF [Pararcticibacter amylolyticus]
MLKSRVIPVLLLKDQGLVKTIKFKHPVYVGDPINAIKIFNEKEVDELIFLDIEASSKGKRPALDLIESIASECFMPFCYGGGINSIQVIREVLKLGVEKVAINSFALENPGFIKEASSIFGSSTIVVSIDVKKNMLGKYRIYSRTGVNNVGGDVLDYARLMEANGAGEILLNSVDRDGSMSGYDIKLVKMISSAVGIPVIACGGAGGLGDFRDAIKDGGASAVGAGSYFVFHGKHKAVLITYPKKEDLESII